MSLNRFLTRLIWVCVFPLILLAVYLAIASVRNTQSEIDIVANNIAITPQPRWTSTCVRVSGR